MVYCLSLERTGLWLLERQWNSLNVSNLLGNKTYILFNGTALAMPTQ